MAWIIGQFVRFAVILRKGSVGAQRRETLEKFVAKVQGQFSEEEIGGDNHD
jgi:hypothetical protein